MSQTEQDRFVDTEMRPIAEKSEQLYYNILSAITSWQKAGEALCNPCIHAIRWGLKRQKDGLSENVFVTGEGDE